MSVTLLLSPVMNKDWVLKNVGRLWRILLITGNNFNAQVPPMSRKPRIVSVLVIERFCQWQTGVWGETSMQWIVWSNTKCILRSSFPPWVHTLPSIRNTLFLSGPEEDWGLAVEDWYLWAYRVSFVQDEKCPGAGFTALWTFLLLKCTLDSGRDGNLYVMYILLTLKT